MNTTSITVVTAARQSSFAHMWDEKGTIWARRFRGEELVPAGCKAHPKVRAHSDRSLGRSCFQDAADLSLRQVIRANTIRAQASGSHLKDLV